MSSPQPSVSEPPASTLTSPSWSTRDGLLEIHVEFDGERWLLRLAGELDRSNVATLEEELGIAEASLAQQIVVALEELGFIDSSGVHALLRAERRSRRSGGRLRVLAGGRRIQSVFRLTGTEERLPFESLQAD